MMIFGFRFFLHIYFNPFLTVSFIFFRMSARSNYEKKVRRASESRIPRKEKEEEEYFSSDDERENEEPGHKLGIKKKVSSEKIYREYSVRIFLWVYSFSECQ